MRMISLPSTDLRVSAICLGTGDLGSTVDQAGSFRLLDAFAAALDHLGMNPHRVTRPEVRDVRLELL